MSKAGTGDGRETMTMLVVVLLLTLMGAGVGFAVGTLLGKGDAGGPPAVAATEGDDPPSKEAGSGEGEGPDVAEAEEAGVPAEDTKIIRLPPVLTTLAEPRGTWIRLEGSILARSESKVSPEQMAEEAGEQILTYLRSVRLDQLESASSVLGLRDDLDDTVRTLSGGDVQRLLIHGLVVE